MAPPQPGDAQQPAAHHPIYAGAYAYGRRPSDPRRQPPGRPGTGRAAAKPEECQVLLRERLPAYISWEQFTRNQKQLEANNAQHRGPVRSGPSLLPGLLVCGRCGLRMTAHYTQHGKGLRYVCSRALTDYGEPLCQSLAGSPLDREVGEWVLKALEPAALEVSLHVAQDLEAERQPPGQRHPRPLACRHHDGGGPAGHCPPTGGAGRRHRAGRERARRRPDSLAGRAPGSAWSGP